MDLSTYLIFVGGSILLCITPGPDMIYVLGRSIAQGKKAGLTASLGINAGAYTHLLAAVLGLSAVLATSSLAFTIVKWVGAAYLIYIGIQALRFPTINLDTNQESQTQLRIKTIFLQGYLSDVLNPKVAIFFLAFLPQFVSSDSANPVWTLLMLGITVNMIGLIVNLILVVLATGTTQKLRRNPKITIILNRMLGGVFIALGIRLANEKFS